MTDTLARMRQLVGTTSHWAGNDLVVGDGEVVLERRTDGQTWAKIGNGTDRYSLLPYFVTESANDLHDWARAYTDGSIGQHVQDAQGWVNVLQAVPAAKRPAILAQTSTDDVAAALQSVLTSYPAYIPEGGFAIGTGLTSAKGVHGASQANSILKPISNSIDALTLADSQRFLKVEDLRVVYATKGTGRGIVLPNANPQTTLANVGVQNAAIGCDAAQVAWGQAYRDCRMDGCTVGFHAKGTNAGGAGAGTAMVYDHCYCTNGCTTGWSLETIRSVTMIQPYTDQTLGMITAISALGVGQLNILDHHFEGTPTVDGQYISYTTSGSMSAGICIIGGCIENADLSARTFRYLNIQANTRTVEVVLIGVNVRSLTGGPNAKLAKLSAASGGRINITAIGCDFGALEDLFDTTAMSGTWSYRKVTKEAGILASGTLTAVFPQTFSAGLGVGLLAKRVLAWYRPATDIAPTVSATVSATFSGNDNIKIRMTNLVNGTEDTTGTHQVNWAVLGP